jgi:hypothetical protein
LAPKTNTEIRIRIIQNRMPKPDNLSVKLAFALMTGPPYARIED